MPMTVLSAANSTRSIEPSGSEATAVSSIGSLTRKVELLAGDVRVTSGGRLAGWDPLQVTPLTVKLVGASLEPL